MRFTKYHFIPIFLFMTCDPSGNVFLTNGYEDDVIVNTFYDYNNSIIERSDKFHEGMVFAVASRNVKYDHIIAIRIKTLNGIVLADYKPEYLKKLKEIYKVRKKQNEYWIFTERGLFFEVPEIHKRYKFDSEKVLEYYRTDEAVQDLQAIFDKEK